MADRYETSESPRETTTVADREATRLETQLHRLHQATARLEDVLERAQRQLVPVARELPKGVSDVPPEEEEYLSPHSTQLRDLARQSNRIADRFIGLFDSLDV
jgi:hypothetical protein